MSKSINSNDEFKQVVILIEEARYRAFQKVNEELVLLYFKVGKLVSEKVTSEAWGEKTVDELANFIELNCPGLKGFNRRGLYRMKQFYELYQPKGPVFNEWVNSKDIKVSPVASQTKRQEEKYEPQIVSPLATHIHDADNQYLKFVSTVLTQISWTNHLEIFSAVKQPEQILYVHGPSVSLTSRQQRLFH